MEVGGCFKRCGDLQEGRFTKRWRNHLQANGKLLTREPTGNGHGRQTSQVYWNGEHIGEVHLERIIEALPETKRCGGRDGSQQGVTLCKGLVKILPEEGTELLGFFVIGIIVTSAQGIGAQHNTSFHFGAKPLSARVHVQIEQVRRLSCAYP